MASWHWGNNINSDICSDRLYRLQAFSCLLIFKWFSTLCIGSQDPYVPKGWGCIQFRLSVLSCFFFWLVVSQPRRFLWPSTDGYRGAKVASSMRHAEEKQKSAAAVQARIALWLPWTTLHAWDLWIYELWAEGRVRHESEMLEWAMDNKNQHCSMFDVDWWKNPQHSIFCWGTKNMQNTILNSARVAEWLLRFLVLCSSSTSNFI